MRPPGKHPAPAASPPVTQERDGPRVVMVAHSHHVGGIERHAVTLAGELAAGGATVAYAGPMRGWLGSQMLKVAHTCVNVPMRGMYDALSAWRLAFFCRRFRASLLHGHAMRGARYADWASRLAGIPAVMTAHSTNSWKWFAPRMNLIAVSAAVRESLIERGFAAERIDVIHNGVPDLSVAPTRHGGPLSSSNPLRLGLIGRVVPDKGHDLAVQALAMLSGRYPVRLLIAGPEDTGWSANLRAQAQRLGVASSIEFLGPRDDIPSLMAGLDLVVAPSRREALSLTLIETAAAGLPCVASRVGGIPEVVVDGRTGWLVPPEDPGALAQALSLAMDAGQRHARGAAARQRYEAHFRADAMCARVRSAYARAAGAPLEFAARTA